MKLKMGRKPELGAAYFLDTPSFESSVGQTQVKLEADFRDELRPSVHHGLAGDLST